MGWPQQRRAFLKKTVEKESVGEKYQLCPHKNLYTTKKKKTNLSGNFVNSQFNDIILFLLVSINNIRGKNRYFAKYKQNFLLKIFYFRTNV